MNEFRKLDANLQILPDDATEWVAVLQVNANLVWSKDDTAADVTAAQAETACSKLHLCKHKDWRLPTAEELFCLADRARELPAINTDFFPTCANDWYWSSTPAAWSPRARWIVGFYNGDSSYYDVDYRCRVRAVRSWSPSSAGQ